MNEQDIPGYNVREHFRQEGASRELDRILKVLRDRMCYDHSSNIGCEHNYCATIDETIDIILTGAKLND